VAEITHSLRGHMRPLLAYSSNTTEIHLCAKCVAPMERVKAGKIGFRNFLCPICGHLEEVPVNNGVQSRGMDWRASHLCPPS
jgi:hypothetical protein